MKIKNYDIISIRMTNIYTDGDATKVALRWCEND